MITPNAAARPGFARICSILAMLALAAPFAASTASAAEKPAERLYLKFNIRSLGLRVATLKFEIGLDPTGYRVQSRMKTKGLLSFIKSSQFNASAKGAVKKSAPVPARFDITTKSSKNGTRNQVIKWNGKRLPTVTRSWNIGDFKTNALASAVRPRMPDPLTALLTATFRSSERLCQDKFQVLDGKTVFNMHYSYIGPDSFGGDDPGVYRGKAHKCQITYRPVAGLSKKKWAKLKAKPNKGTDTFTIWMAPVKADGLGRVLYVPVGASARLDGRQIYAYLVAAVLSGKPLNEHSLTAQN